MTDSEYVTNIESEDTEDFDATSVQEARSAKVSPIPVLPQLSIAIGMLVLVFGITYVGVGGLQKTNQVANTAVQIEKHVPSDEETPSPSHEAFKNIHLQAKSAMVWDGAEHKALFSKDPDESLPLASITKLMTALVSYELLDPTDVVTITDTAIQTEGDSGLLPGEQFTVQNLTDLTLIESSNDGATALAMSAGNKVLPHADGADVFVTAMNVKAKELGLTQTHYKNSTGLDLSETEAGAFGSARDMVHLMEYFITTHPDAVALTTLSSKNIYDTQGRFHTVENTNEFVGSIDGLIASKTGYTLLAGGNLVIAVNVGLNHPIIIAVLGSTASGRFTDALTLLKEARSAVASQT